MSTVLVKYRAITGLGSETYTASRADVLPDGTLRINEPLGTTFVAAGMWFSCVQDNS